MVLLVRRMLAVLAWSTLFCAGENFAQDFEGPALLLAEDLVSGEHISAEGAPEELAPGDLTPPDPPSVEDVDPSPGPFSQAGPEYDALNLATVLSSGTWFNQGAFFAQSDLVLLWRTRANDKFLSRDVSLAASRILDTAATSFRFVPGNRTTIGVFLGRDAENRDQSIEFSFLGLYDWVSDQSMTALSPNSILLAGDPGLSIGGFNGADQHEIQYSSDLKSFEINLRMRYRLGRDRMVVKGDGSWTRQVASGQTPSLFVGIRYITIEEGFIWKSSGVDVFTATGPFSGNLFVNSHNEMIGIQFGGDWFWQEKRWRVGARTKVGGFVNYGSQTTAIQTVDGRLDLGGNPRINLNGVLSGRDQVIAFVSEAGFNISYHFNPSVSFRAGYNTMWAYGLAGAADQVSFSPAAPRGVDLNASTFFHGLSLGLEIVR